LEHANSRKLEILEYNPIHSLSKYHPSIPMHLQCCSIIIYLFSLYKLLAASTFYSLSSFDASLNRQLIIIFYTCCVWQYFYLTLSTKLLVHLNYVFWFQPKKKNDPPFLKQIDDIFFQFHVSWNDLLLPIIVLFIV